MYVYTKSLCVAYISCTHVCIHDRVHSNNAVTASHSQSSTSQWSPEQPSQQVQFVELASEQPEQQLLYPLIQQQSAVQQQDRHARHQIGVTRLASYSRPSLFEHMHQRSDQYRELDCSITKCQCISSSHFVNESQCNGYGAWVGASPPSWYSQQRPSRPSGQSHTPVTLLHVSLPQQVYRHGSSAPVGNICTVHKSNTYIYGTCRSCTSSHAPNPAGIPPQNYYKMSQQTNKASTTA